MRTIAQISDLHFGRHDRRVAEDLLASLRADHPDLVAISGDFTQRARRAEFEEASAYLARIAPHKLLVPGNHDVPLYNMFRRFRAPLGRYFRYIAPSGVPDDFYRDEEIAVLGLNTTRRLLNTRGRISFEQIAHVRRAFRDVPDTLFKILMTHHPLAVPAGQFRSALAQRARLALMMLADSHIHLLLSGHRHHAVSGHREEDTELAGERAILVLHAGTAISTRTRGGEANSYNLLRIDAERVTVAVKVWSSQDGFRTIQDTSYRLKAGRWLGA